MSKNPQQSQRPDSASPAVHQVLEAETAARERILKAEERARSIVEHARSKARAIEQRAVETAGTIQQIERQRAELRIEKLSLAAQQRLDEVKHVPLSAAMEQACDRMVQWLTTPSSVGAPLPEHRAPPGSEE